MLISVNFIFMLKTGKDVWVLGIHIHIEERCPTKDV